MKKMMRLLMVSTFCISINAMLTKSEATSSDGSLWIHYHYYKKGIVHYCCRCVEGSCKGVEHSHSYNKGRLDLWSDLNITFDELERLHDKQQNSTGHS